MYYNKYEKIKSNKIKSQKLERYNLYEMTGKNDNNIYIGITRNPFLERIKQHFSNKKTNDICLRTWTCLENINYKLLGYYYATGVRDAEYTEQLYIYQYENTNYYDVINEKNDKKEFLTSNEAIKK